MCNSVCVHVFCDFFSFVDIIKQIFNTNSGRFPIDYEETVRPKQSPSPCCIPYNHPAPVVYPTITQPLLYTLQSPSPCCIPYNHPAPVVYPTITPPAPSCCPLLYNETTSPIISLIRKEYTMQMPLADIFIIFL